MLTHKDYCDYDICVALKELGYNQYTSLMSYAGKGGVRLWDFDGEPHYKEGELIALSDMFDIPRDGNEVAAPSLYEAQKWLREEKHMDVNAFYDNIDAAWRFYILEIDSPDLSGTYAYKDIAFEFASWVSPQFKLYLIKEFESFKIIND